MSKNALAHLLSLALIILSLTESSSAQTTGLVYQDANLVMGYIESTQTANVSGYDSCFTSVGNYLFVRSDNSANIEPNFRVSAENGTVKITKNAHATGRGAYVCHKNSPITKEVISGYAATGTAIGTNLSCVLSIANFTKLRIASGTVPGSLTCGYNATTGKIEASATEAGVVPLCGYVCVSNATNKVSNVISRSYNVLSGSENIGSNHRCALGTTYFQSECSGLAVTAASYTSSTGIAVKGNSGGCTRSSHSYFCLDTTTPLSACANGIDDDGDGLIDLADPGCSGPTDTNETNPTGPACDNGVDDDGDSLIDFPRDPGCSSVTDTTETNPNGPACDNGRDDDGDGLIDFPRDPGCASVTDTTETNPNGPACDNGRDDDGDDLVDFAEDPGCSTPTDTTETNPNGPACDNGRDDDGDGLIDFAQDPGCSSVTDNSETDPITPACNNGIDDDDDGRTDFPQDPGCSSANDTTETNPNGPECDNGRDDDLDGRIDVAQDPDCDSPTDTTESPADPVACNNGADDDGDGRIDFPTDKGCSSPTDATETNPNGPACDNGRDDDGDNLIDFAQDPGCGSPDDGSESNPNGPECDNGRDDDGDGLRDLAQDPDCTSVTDDSEDSSTIPGIPQNVQASDGTDPDFVKVSWNAVTGAASYQVFRSDILGQPGSVIGSTSTTNFDDASAVPGVVYYYSILARNSAGSSARSAQDSGFIADTGRLKSPVFTKFNTFLDQMNFLELISSGSKAISVKVTIYNLRGVVMKTKTVSVAAGSELDLAIHSEVLDACVISNPLGCLEINPRETYGLVKLEFDSSDPKKTLLGRMSNYRLDPNGTSYSFAFAKELRNPIRGRSFTATNTVDPQGAGFLVPNWAEIINLSRTTKEFIYRLYTQEGVMVFSKRFKLRSLEERDIQAGHEIFNVTGSVREAAYLAEVIPLNSGTEYLFSVTRYSSNSPVGTVPRTYNFAFALDARSGSTGKLFAPISNENRDSDCAVVANWLELVNVQDKTVGATVILRNANGASLLAQRINIAAKSQFHFNASALFPTKAIGVAEIRPDMPGTIVAQSLSYFNDICGSNLVQTAYASPAQGLASKSQAGTLNTFIQMEDTFRVFATSGETSSAIFNLKSFRGGSSSGILSLSPFNSSEVQISSNPTFNFPADTNGLITLQTTEDGQAMAQVLRTRRQVGKDGKRRLDFVMPTAVR